VFHGEEFDYACYACAPIEQRARALTPSARIELEGLARGGGLRTVELPGLAPRATVEDPWRGVREVPLTLDTLWLDVDRELIVTAWRGDVEVIENGREIDRIVAWLDRAAEPRSFERILPLLQRGHVSYARRAADCEPAADPVPDDDDLLRMHRFRCWRSAAPEPTLPIADYARISAELCECGTPVERTAVLERHGLDDPRWIVEERAWLEKLGRSGLDGDVSMAALYSVHFVRAQDALGTAAEQATSFEEYLDLSAAMLSTAEPTRVLEQRGLTLPKWMRLERRYQAEMQQDPALARRYRERMGSVRAEPPAEPEGLGS
jgi:hypothetical protein